MEKIKLSTLKCKRCKHKWIPRTTKKPNFCPKCNSPYWDKERGWYQKTKNLKKNKIVTEYGGKYIGKLESQLLSADRNNAKLTSSWSISFPTHPGVYIAWKDNIIVYVGETGSLRGRMNDLRDTRHHTLRRHIGFELFGVTASTTEKFSPNNEKTLESYIHENISISYLRVKLGRKELEEQIVDKHDPFYNQKGKRA